MELTFQTLPYLGRVFGEMDTALEAIVEVSLATPPRQDLGLDHVLLARELGRDPRRLFLVGCHAELLDGYSVVLPNLEKNRI
jgi:hypothetical protein